jgi:hypothetical protein
MDDAHEPHADEDPPPPPDYRRRVRLYPSQWIGVPLLLLVPVLALAGVFGETRTTRELRDDVLHYSVEYPTRLRAGQTTLLRIRIVSIAATAPDSVTVTLDAAFMERFDEVRIMPEPARPWAVVVTGMAPGDSAEVQVELAGRALGRSRGGVTLEHTGGAPRDVAITTIVFP